MRLLDPDALATLAAHISLCQVRVMRQVNQQLRQIVTRVRSDDLAMLFWQHHLLHRWMQRWKQKPIVVLTHSWMRRQRHENQPIFMM